MSGLSSSAWFTGDDGPADPPSERPVPPVAAPVSAARTLPVTPAERACATVLRAYLAWASAEDDIGPIVPVMVDLGVALRVDGLLSNPDTASPAGAALLARVEAAERTPLPPVPMLSDDAAKSPTAALLWFADEGHYEGTYRKGAGFAEACGMSIARKALGLLVDRPDNTLMPLSEALAARLAGTTPIDAPPAKEPR